ncbi:hypothetical protein [Prochlorococcus sp. MIT 1341]|uniref:hypothetical protein n=1 Tax=Prochlorococcus sp. MIT 1341 TaxID=3096221 RepID=UPI002A7645CE|nr:hypothetical protein [Prochlorococcus sp. MIT 1341]
MRYRIRITIFALLTALSCSSASVVAETNPLSSSRVLAQKSAGFNADAVESLIKKGDSAASSGKLEEAKKNYDQARSASKQLLSFYRDLSGAFRGLDARIPREMDAKGRRVLGLLAKTNLRLAALFRRQNQPEIAVPVLVEVVRLMSPAKPEGQKAYQRLLELGFVETPYSSADRKSFN